MTTDTTFQGSGKSLSLLCAASAWLQSAEKDAPAVQQAGAPEEPYNPDGGYMPVDPSSSAPKNSNDENRPANRLGEGGCASGCASGKCQGEGEEEAAAVNEMAPRIYFASRTHSQIAQLIRSARFRPDQAFLFDL